MTTVIVNIPEKKEHLFIDFLKKNHLKMQILKSEEDEDLMAKWIDEGLKSPEVSEEIVFETLRKNGVKKIPSI
jgi:hypothetical protein